MVTFESMSQAFEYYTSRDIIVHPVQAAIKGDSKTGKAPLPKNWQTKDKPYDSRYIAQCVRDGCNIGANCGKASNLTVIDIDCYIKGIFEALFSGVNVSELVTAQRTEKEGRKHYFFKYCPELETTQYQALGFDIRNDKGNIVLAPSVHYSGDIYRLQKDIAERTEIPQSMIENYKTLVKTYNNLKKVLLSCRKPWRELYNDIFENKTSDIYKDVRIFRADKQGRDRHLGICSEILRNCEKSGLSNDDGEQVLLLLCMLIFGDSYNKEFSIKEMNNVKPEYTWTKETIANDEYLSKYKYNSSESESGYRVVTDEELNELRLTHNTLRLDLNLPKDHFITQFVDWTDSLNDGYKEYKIVTAFWLLSALVQQKVYSRWSTGTVYPNIWAFLIGPSTISRKTTVIDNGRDIYVAATGNTIPDTDYSIEGYAEALVETPVLNCVRDEVSTLLSKMGQNYNAGYFEFECSMYDGKPYVKTLASKGKGKPQSFVVEKTYITKLYATTPVKLAQSMSVSAFDSGFGFRFLFASPSYSRELKGHRRLTDEDTERWAAVAARVKGIYNIFKESPEIHFDIEPDAERFYSEKTLEILNKLAKEEYCNETLLAVWGRLETYIIKLAMLIEIGKPQISLKITLESIIIAFSMVCNYFVPSTISVYNQLLEDTRFNNIEKIIKELRRMRGIATHKDLLKNCKLVAKDFNECIETMQESGAIEVVIAKSKNNKDAKTYILKDEDVNKVPKNVFDIERIISTLQIPQERQIPQVLKFSDERGTSENLENLQKFKELDRTFYKESLDDAILLSKDSQSLQILSPSPYTGELENLGNLTPLRNLRSEPAEKEALDILNEEGY